MRKNENILYIISHSLFLKSQEELHWNTNRGCSCLGDRDDHHFLLSSLYFSTFPEWIYIPFIIWNCLFESKEIWMSAWVRFRRISPQVQWEKLSGLPLITYLWLRKYPRMEQCPNYNHLKVQAITLPPPLQSRKSTIQS